MSKWTAGPWTYAKDPSGIATVAWVAAYRVGPDHGMSEMADYSGHGLDEADARLIAAAPDLADALLDLLNDVGSFDPRMEPESHVNARAALTKAGAL